MSIWVCLKIVYPIVPNGFADHYPVFKWLAIIGKINPTFSGPNPSINGKSPFLMGKSTINGLNGHLTNDLPMVYATCDIRRNFKNRTLRSRCNHLRHVRHLLWSEVVFKWIPSSCGQSTRETGRLSENVGYIPNEIAI